MSFGGGSPGRMTFEIKDCTPKFIQVKVRVIIGNYEGLRTEIIQPLSKTMYNGKPSFRDNSSIQPIKDIYPGSTILRMPSGRFVYLGAGISFTKSHPRAIAFSFSFKESCYIYFSSISSHFV